MGFVGSVSVIRPKYYYPVRLLALREKTVKSYSNIMSIFKLRKKNNYYYYYNEEEGIWK